MSTHTTQWTAGPGEGASAHTLGGKAFGLDRLDAVGVAVPRWFAVTCHAMDEVLRPFAAAIDDAVRSSRVDERITDQTEERILSIVCSAPWPVELSNALQKRLASFPADTCSFAVRSSAVGEDGAKDSHAGQFASFLGVSRAGVADAVRRAWASAYSGRAMLYREVRRINETKLRLAVIVQELIHSEVSGVVFTADPVTGAPDLMISAGYGLGEGVVADLVTTDTYLCRAGVTDWERTIRAKTERVIAKGRNTGGTEIQSVPAPRRCEPALCDNMLSEIANAARRIERAAGYPQDIEWGIDAAGVLFVLQARPISALPDGDLAVWDDANIGEGYPGVTLPLTYSYVQHAYQTVFRHALVDVGVAPQRIEALEETLANLVGHIGGRIYLNLTNYHRLFATVPGIGSLVPQWEDGLGIPHNGTDAALPPPRLRFGTPWIHAAWTWCNLARRYLEVQRVTRCLRATVLALARSKRDDHPQSVTELLQTLRRIDRELLPWWAYHVYNDLFSFLFHDVLTNLCGGDELLRRRLLSGIHGLESMEPLESLQRLARAVHGAAPLRALFESTAHDRRVWEAIQSDPTAAEFRARVTDHLRTYGDRTVHELKLEAETPATAPWLLVNLIRSVLATAEPDDVRPERRPERTSDALAELLARHRGHPLLRLLDRLVVTHLRRAIATRETMSLARARAYGVVRRLVKRIGRELVRTGALHAESDVFYLTLEEIDQHAQGVLPGVSSLVARRRGVYKDYEDWDLPHRVVCRGSPSRLLFPRVGRPPPETDSVMQGVPCSFGVARGRARVVKNVTAVRPVRGEILVASATEPGWIFLMHCAAGLVVERGSFLSHAAIVGRELGLPTVVGVERATERIATGDEIEVDGGTGAVRVLNRK